MIIGSHVSPQDPLGEAAARGADAVQIFMSNPQQWKAPIPREDVDELISSDIDFYVHAPYLINLASANNRVRIPSRKMVASSCTTESGGSPPLDTPRLMEPRVGWKRMPNVRAASTV